MANTDTGILLDLLEDMTGKARTALARRIAAIPELQERLARDPGCPGPVLADLARNRRAEIRRAVAGNPATSRRTRNILKTDKAASVRRIAEDSDDGGTGRARRAATARTVHTETNVNAWCKEARSEWTGPRENKYPWGNTTHVPLSKLVKSDPVWSAERRLIEALLQSPSMEYASLATFACHFDPYVFGNVILHLDTAGTGRGIETDTYLTLLAYSAHKDPRAQTDFIRELLERDPDRVRTLASRKAAPGSVQAFSSKDKTTLLRLVRHGGVAGALAAGRDILTLADVLRAAADGLEEEVALSGIDKDRTVTALPSVLAERIEAEGDAIALLAQGDEATTIVGMLGLLPGLRERALLTAATTPGMPDHVLEGAAVASGLPTEARRALVSHDDPWIRSVTLTREDCTSTDAIAAVNAGEDVDERVLRLLNTEDMIRLPWRCVDEDDRVRKVAARLLSPVFAQRPAAIDVIATMHTSFDGTIEEMVAAARLL